VLLLALDTSTTAVGAAVHDGHTVVAEAGAVDARRHGELLAPAIEAALAQAGRRPAELTAVVVGVGPGPFTGLRVGVVTALVMGAALGVPVHGICSLDAVAWAFAEPGAFVVVTDARRREVYWACYDGPRTRVGLAAVGPPAAAAAAAGRGPVVGPGTGLHPFADPRPSVLSAGALAELGAHRITSGGQLLAPRPLYLRRPDATVPGARKAVLP